MFLVLLSSGLAAASPLAIRARPLHLLDGAAAQRSYLSASETGNVLRAKGAMVVPQHSRALSQAYVISAHP